MGRRVAQAGSRSRACDAAKQLFARSSRASRLGTAFGLLLVAAVVVFAGSVDANAAVASRFSQPLLGSSVGQPDQAGRVDRGSGKPTRVRAPRWRWGAASLAHSALAAPSSSSVTRAKAGVAPLVSDPQGDQLSLGLTIGAVSGGGVLCFSSDWGPVEDGSTTDVCYTISLTDSISGNFAPATNNGFVSWYDACGALVRTTNYVDSYTQGYPGQVENGSIGVDPLLTVPTSGGLLWPMARDRQLQ
jgi:hypothetical protein